MIERHGERAAAAYYRDTPGYDGKLAGIYSRAIHDTAANARAISFLLAQYHCIIWLTTTPRATRGLITEYRKFDARYE